MDGFVGGDADVVEGVGRRLAGAGRELGELAEATRSAAGRAAGAVGHDALASALDGWAATWGCGLLLVAAQVAAVATLATSGAVDLHRIDLGRTDR